MESDAAFTQGRKPRSHHVVVADEALEHSAGRALSRAAGAFHKHDRLHACVARDEIAEPLLQQLGGLEVAAPQLIKEVQPESRTGGVAVEIYVDGRLLQAT